MYNNRRNNRFSIFIAAIIVSLLVLLTGCASTKKETDLAKPVAEDSSNPVTLTVYLTAHYANPDTHCPIYEKLLSQYSSYRQKRVIPQSVRQRFIS